MSALLSDDMTTLRDALRKEHLPQPPIPASLQPQLRRLEDWVWGTRETPEALYDVGSYVAESLQSPPGDYVLVGQDGYGTNAWYFHCYITQGPVSIFIQAPWGGAYADPKLAAQKLQRRYELAQNILDAADHLTQAGRPLPGRLIVEQAATSQPRWCWATPGAEPEWHEDPQNAMAPALAALKALG